MPPAKGKRHKGLIILGLVLLIGGILGGGAMVAKSMSNYESSVKALARAPVGCTTTLVFDKPATFTIYLETKGKVGDIGGDCEANGATYDHSGDKLPKVSLSLTNSKGDELDLQRGTTASYDAAGFVGSGYRTVEITDAGTYKLNVESDESDFAVSIGKNPKDDSDLLKTIGGAVALGGLVLGLMFLLLGLRRRKPTTTGGPPGGPITAWSPTGYAPVPTGPPSPPRHPGYRPDDPLLPGTVPTQPPIRIPEQPPGTGFAPPSMVPPPPPPPPPPAPGWTVPDDDED